MYSGFKIGKIFGTLIVADWSWILFLLIMTGALGGVVLPELYPQWDFTLTWGAALTASLLFFASVLVHESAHLLAARASQLAVREVTLFPFGGITNILRASTAPAEKMVVAVVGPASSLLLGAVVLLLGLARAGELDKIMGAMPPSWVGLDPLALFLLWLGAINVLLGVLNLIPGFPLDGGRALRSILWEMTRNQRRATGWASRAGQLTTWGLVVAGVWIAVTARAPFAAVGFLCGFLLCFLGWVLNQAIGQMDRQVAAQDLLTIVPVARFMSTRVPTVPPNIPLSSLMDDYAIGNDDTAFPVIENDHLVGLICVQDVCKVPREKWDTTEVGEIMTSAGRVAIARPDKVGGDALLRFSQACEMAASVPGVSVGQENG